MRPLIGQSLVFSFGNLYADEIKRLVAEGSIDAQEAAALIAQADMLVDLTTEVLAGRGKRRQLLEMLPRIGDQRRIESMLRFGCSPRVVREVRQRRFRSYCRIWRSARKEFLADSLEMRERYIAARDWASYLREQRRRVAAEILFAELYLAGIRYRMGLRSDMAAMTDRITELLTGLPHRGDCSA